MSDNYATLQENASGKAFEHIKLKDLIEAVRDGNALVSKTKLKSVMDDPEIGDKATIAPARYKSSDGSDYAEGRIFINGVIEKTVLINSKQAQINVMEAALQKEAEKYTDGIVARIPNITIKYSEKTVGKDKENLEEEPVELSLRDLPHRIFDAHIRLAHLTDNSFCSNNEQIDSVFWEELIKDINTSKKTDKEGKEFIKTTFYQNIRNSTNNKDIFRLLCVAPESLLFGVWDSHRQFSKQNRRASIVMGEIYGIIGTLQEFTSTRYRTSGRRDPYSPAYNAPSGGWGKFEEVYKDEYSTEKGKATAADIGLGNTVPTVGQSAEPDGISPRLIIRNSMLSFAGLRELGFGCSKKLEGEKYHNGDEALRVLLAALGLHAIALSEKCTRLRTNCDLESMEKSRVFIRGKFDNNNCRYYSELDSERTRKLLEDAYKEIEILIKNNYKKSINWDKQNIILRGNEKLIRGKQNESKAPSNEATS